MQKSAQNFTLKFLFAQAGGEIVSRFQTCHEFDLDESGTMTVRGLNGYPETDVVTIHVTGAPYLAVFAMQDGKTVGSHRCTDAQRQAAIARAEAA